MLRNDPAGVITIVAKLAKRGKNLETLFEEMLGALRAVELCALLPQPETVLDETPESIAAYRQLGTCAPNSDVVLILLEQLAPAGRSLRDALDRQIVLETLVLKAMREAHAVRIDDILRRLNQLRTAGELKFLEQLPVVERPLPIPGTFTAPAPAPVVEAAPAPAPVAEEPERERRLRMVRQGTTTVSSWSMPIMLAPFRGRTPITLKRTLLRRRSRPTGFSPGKSSSLTVCPMTQTQAAVSTSRLVK
jgi:DNA polymerase III gamma/tau subunit